VAVLITVISPPEVAHPSSQTAQPVTARGAVWRQVGMLLVQQARPGCGSGSRAAASPLSAAMGHQQLRLIGAQVVIPVPDQRPRAGSR
jgi:hypothetical protein